jgi:hypothetical protein
MENNQRQSVRLLCGSLKVAVWRVGDIVEGQYSASGPKRWAEAVVTKIVSPGEKSKC